jgi:2'-5' RNA ligase
MTFIALSEKGSLIVPVAKELFGLKDGVQDGEAELRPKAELHLTVFNFGIGRLVHKACEAEPGLKDTIEGLARGFDWSLRVTGPYLRLRRDKLTTIVVQVEAGIADFFAAVREKTQHPELREALRHPGPPHVTLYTSDPEGKAGIGLNTDVELEAALERGKSGAAAGLRAWTLAGPP